MIKVLLYGLLIVGLLFILSPDIDAWITQKKQKGMVDDWKNKVEAYSVEQDDELWEEVLPISGVIDLTEQPEELESTSAQDEDVEKDLQQLIQEINGQQVKGLLRIPKIDYQGVIIPGTSERALSLGVGTVVKGRAPGKGNFVLAGHRSLTYGHQFNRLGELKIDDSIEIETLDNVYSYVVSDILIVEPTDLFVLQDSTEHAILTLITCEPLVRDAPYRLIIKATML
ncbi:hypothetical protein BHF68_07975 [Desulfuribacillus alkaliarsenatis]|uniref:Class D sortase n=2 Tax=Desulfuribacillus alkaliarsenatis TaxID=766136 RepID=A0A1E5G167_9FIRM|nr:hypothetical protein BHF68_07975 [Desulfuribacillus alkaliarsenatis]